MKCLFERYLSLSGVNAIVVILFFCLSPFEAINPLRLFLTWFLGSILVIGLDYLIERWKKKILSK